MHFCESWELACSGELRHIATSSIVDKQYRLSEIDKEQLEDIPELEKNNSPSILSCCSLPSHETSPMPCLVIYLRAVFLAFIGISIISGRHSFVIMKGFPPIEVPPQITLFCFITQQLLMSWKLSSNREWCIRSFVFFRPAVEVRFQDTWFWFSFSNGKHPLMHTPEISWNPLALPPCSHCSNSLTRANPCSYSVAFLSLVWIRFFGWLVRIMFQPVFLYTGVDSHTYKKGLPYFELACFQGLFRMWKRK